MPVILKELAVDYTWVENHLNLFEYYEELTRVMFDTPYIKNMKE